MEQINKKMEFGQILIRRYMIIGERRISNYWWAFIISLGSLGFLLTGISSYLKSFITQNIEKAGDWTASQTTIPLSESSLLGPLSGDGAIGQNILIYSEGTNSNLIDTISASSTLIVPFFPQGLLMSFYGSLGILLSLYWWFLIFWNVGSGFNEFNKKDGFIRVFRWGYPGKNRKIDLSYSLKDVEAIKVELKQGLDPQRTIYLKLKGNREIPLTGIGQPLTLKDIEKQASELANFLQVSLEGL